MSLRLDITPGNDPLGTILEEITDQDYHGLRVRVERNGGGSGQFLIPGDHAKVTAANFAYGNYVRVFDTDLSEYIAGFWLKEGEFTAVSAGEQGGRMLTFGGWGSVGYLGRARWAEAPYVASGTGVYNGPRDDGRWYWFNDQYGDILKRMIDEAQDADRPFDPIPDLTYDFGNTTDSNGDPWSSFTGNYSIPMGTNYLDSVQEFMRLGLLIWVTPNLLLQAFQGEPGTGRAGAAFGAGVVRFEHGVNIVAPEDLTHSIHETPRVKHLLVQGSSSLPADVISLVDAGAPLDKEGFLNAGQTDDVDVLTEAGEADLGLRAGVYDTARFIMVRGDNEGAGFYLPGWPGGAGHFWLSDLVTIHTGTEFADFNEVDMRVAAISWTVREKAGDVENAVELGSVYYSVTDPSVAQVMGGCTCSPHIPSGPYGDAGATIDYLWDTFPSGGSPAGEDDTGHNIGSGPKYGGGGFVYAGALDPHCGSEGFALPAGSYHFRATIRSSSSTGSPKNIYMRNSGVSIAASSNVGTTATEVGFDFTADGTPGTVYDWRTGGPETGRKSEVYFVEISHGGGGDYFAGDSPPPASSDQIGSIGSGSQLALANHQHPAQSASVTLIGDEGGYYTGESVEDALQELGVMVSAGGGAVGFQPVSLNNRFPVWGHRGDIGSTDSLPENTLESVLQCALKGIQGAEIDVRLSSDGTFHLMHDATVDRTTDGSGAISGKTDAAIAALNVNAGFGYISGSYDVPTLASVLEALNPYDFMLSIQLAASSDANATALAEQVVDAGWIWRAVIEVSTLSEAAAVKAVSSSLTVMVNDTVSGADADDNVDWLSMEWGTIADLAEIKGKAPKHVKSYISIADFPADEDPIIADMFAFGVSAYQTDNIEQSLPLRQALVYGGGTTGTTDHGALTGLGDDDHPQYLTEAEHGVVDHSGSALVTVDAGTVTYDHSGEDVDISIDTVWGIDGDGAYYDSAGAVSGEEAALMYDPATDSYLVLPYNP